jgi:hypothetical protein
MLVHVLHRLGGDTMKCAIQRYNLEHFISLVIGVVKPPNLMPFQEYSSSIRH